jgi:endonuclease I
MKSMKLSISLVCFLSSIGIFAQIPEGYYNSVAGLSSYELKSALHEIIDNHSSQTYTALWSHFEKTDKKADGSVWDMYSDIPQGTPPYTFTFFSDQCGNYSNESDCYNREHSFPKSWFNDGYPMYSDLFHLYPTDGYVNGKRGNFPFGEVGSATFTSLNGSKTGTCSYPGYSGIVFEPIDEYKGDFARSYFYMATRYEDIISGWENYSSQGNTILDGSSDKVYESWFLNLLLDWHHQDTVSLKEINRNNKIYAIQGNRNPFIDHPEYVDCIWLNQCKEEPDPVIIPNCNGLANFPASSDSPVWVEEWIVSNSQEDDDTTYIFYALIGDTTIQDLPYSKIYELSDTTPTVDKGLYWGAIRKDTCGRVWYHRDNTDYLLYDFSVKAGDTVFYQPIGQLNEQYLIVDKTDSVILNDSEYYSRYSFINSSQTWIEGVGDTRSFLWSSAPFPDCDVYLDTDQSVNCENVITNLNCLYKKNELLYKNCPGSCYPTTKPNDTIINKPDTCIKCLDFPNSGSTPVWIEEWVTQDLLGAYDTSYIFYTLSGDTILNKTTYSKLYKSTDYWPADSNSVFIGALRSDTCGRVWLNLNNMENLLYDFSLAIQDTFFYQPEGTSELANFIVESVDLVLLKDKINHNLINFKNSENVWVGGVGDIFSLLWNNIPFPDCGAASLYSKNINCGILTTKLNCFYNNNKLVFKNCLGECYKNESSGIASIKKYEGHNLLRIYPNPASNSINILFNDNESHSYILKITNSTGQLLHELTLEQANNSIDISDFEAGIYIISLSDVNNNFFMTEKIIISQ